MCVYMYMFASHTYIHVYVVYVVMEFVSLQGHVKECA